MTLGILITYFNEGEDLRKCLLSLAAQGEKPDEILIYDDASQIPPDPFIPPGISVHVIRGKNNIGPGRGRNQLLLETKSTFIHFHDADDLFAEDWCEKVKKCISPRDRDAVFTEIAVSRNGRRISDGIQGLVPMSSSDELVRFCLRRGAILTSAGTYRTSIVKEIGGYRESLWQSEDYDFHIRLAARGISFDILLEPLIIRTQAAGRSRDRKDVWDSALQSIILLSSELSKKFNLDLSEGAARISSALFRVGGRDRAKVGFQLAEKLGPPLYESQHRIYRIFARIIGAQATEWIGLFYRSLIPGKLRSLLRFRLSGNGIILKSN